MLRPSLVDKRSRLLIYKSIVKPQRTYAWKALYETSNNMEKRLDSALYQCLKSLMAIRSNVSRIKLLEVLHQEKDSDINKKKHNLIELLSLKVIKLRVRCLFSYRKERSWNCTHKINSKEIIQEWSKIEEWRKKWNKTTQLHGVTITTALLKLTHVREKKTAKIISEIINEATEELTQRYFQKKFSQ